MKTNLYILLILLLSFSFGNAQSTLEVVKVDTNDTVSVSNNDNKVIVAVEESTDVVNENEVLLIDASQLKESIARSSSDIRIYLNRERKVDNLKLVFPKINKAIKA
ncbi:hypothetical protein [Thalassobellus sediminis]|uniref:hypothetical protein n=1 Tax=Thalassobellus sediminis TaxID=3367753 RepID=UPI0037BE19F8